MIRYSFVLVLFLLFFIILITTSIQNHVMHYNVEYYVSILTLSNTFQKDLLMYIDTFDDVFSNKITYLITSLSFLFFGQGQYGLLLVRLYVLYFDTVLVWLSTKDAFC